MNFTTLASWPLLAWKTLEGEGKDPRPLFEAVGLDPDLVDKAGARFPAVRVNTCFEEAARLSDASCFGLAAARRWHPTTLHAVGIAWFSSSTLDDAFRRVVRNLAVVSTGTSGRLVRDDEGCHFSLVPKLPEFQPLPEGPHAALAVLVEMCRKSLDEAFRPLRVRLMDAVGRCDASLRAYFGCPIDYNADCYGLVIAAEDLDRPLPTANMDLLIAADRMIAAYLAEIDRGDIGSRARAEIFRQLPSGTTTEESVASALHMSLRTFQRRLKEEGTVYRQLLENVRRELAEQYIANPSHSITEISYLLGFSEPSSFARSFRRWTGSSPSEQRDTLAGA